MGSHFARGLYPKYFAVEIKLRINNKKTDSIFKLIGNFLWRIKNTAINVMLKGTRKSIEVSKIPIFVSQASAKIGKRRTVKIKVLIICTYAYQVKVSILQIFWIAEW